jgi:predicted transcriptional regulator
MQKPTLGDQELELLRYIAAQSSVTVGEAAEGFGMPRDLSRSTIVTVMERLRKKGFLARKKQDGVFRYAAAAAQEEILGGLVQRFVENTLKGSLMPFVTYFAKGDKLSSDEMDQLQRLIAKLQSEDQKSDQKSEDQAEPDTHMQEGTQDKETGQ